MVVLKNEKEQFVSNLLGGTITEIYEVTFVALSSFLCYVIYFSVSNREMNFVFDFALNCISLLLAITLYSSKPKLLHLLLLAPFVAYCLFSSMSGRSKTTKLKKGMPTPKSNSNENHAPSLLPRKAFITTYRSHMMIITNLAILAVDFNLFPRRFAKVETWGTSLMDLGVGSFVFSMGLVNCRAVIKESVGISPRHKFNVKSYLHLIYKNTVKSLPILLLGIIRCLSVKSLEYQEHVTEYGVHWNFFMTLGLLPIFIGLLDPLLSVLPRALISLMIISLVEVVLQKLELLSYIVRNDNRMNNLITMNKEGIVSFAGYLSIFLFGQSIGFFTLTGYKTPLNLLGFYGNSKLSKKLTLTKDLSVSTTQGLAITSVIYSLMFYYVLHGKAFLGVSRRLSNLSYVLWVVSYNTVYLQCYNIIERFSNKPLSVSPIVNAINNNGLACFLLANLLTGLVNMTIDTLNCGPKTTLTILLLYACAWCIPMLVLDKKGIYLRL